METSGHGTTSKNGTTLPERGNVDFRIVKQGKRSHKGKGTEDAGTRPFVVWDGEECKDAGYCLFGSSAGLYARKPHLSTREMLELIIDTGKAVPNAFHVGFAFYYDVNQILKDLSKLRIAVLHKTGKVMWEGFQIEHVPHKIFTVSKFDDETGKKIKVRIDDCFSYFRQRFDKALIKYDIGSREERAAVTEGKDARQDFFWKDIDFIEQYWRKELRLLVDLMDRIRKDVHNAGYKIGQWHGPGALASYALRQHEMGQFKRETPEKILPAVLSAYSAGWFERFQAGVHDGEVYTADINSAYVHAISLLPNLAIGEWSHIDNPDRFTVRNTRFALYHIKMRGGFKEFMGACHGIPGPLPIREKSGTISHPVQVDGWYWSPEAALVSGRPDVEITEAWIFDDDGSHPFAWVNDDYRHRLTLQKLGNPAEKVIKWMLASLYGRLAQRVGWNEKTRKPPAWHQLEWAGFITSMCRSMCYRAAMDVARRGGLVSIDTDGIMSTVPFNDKFLSNGTGDGLGEWKIEKYFGLIYIQNGIYWLRKEDGTWEEPKLRGIPKEQVKDESKAMAALAGDGKIHLSKERFVGMGQALNGNWNSWRRWEESPHVIDVNYSGKRQHTQFTCRACRRGYSMTECLHDLAPIPADTVESQPHVLPWMNPKVLHMWEIMREYAVKDDL